MNTVRSRFLRPSVLALLPTGLWAADKFHPVAAVLDPAAGGVGLPWDSDVAAVAAAAEYGASEGIGPDWDDTEKPVWDQVGNTPCGWDYGAPPNPPDVGTDHHRWRFGWMPELARHAADDGPLIATAPDGAEVRRWQLGRGVVLSTVSLGDRLAVIVLRAGSTPEVLALHPVTDEVTVLLPLRRSTSRASAGPWCPARSKPTPMSASARWSRLSFCPGQLSDVRATLDGDWPDTNLEWNFRWTGRAGLVLRRRVRLFDEIGRTAYPELAVRDLGLTMEFKRVPPAEDAVGGVLDV